MLLSLVVKWVYSLMYDRETIQKKSQHQQSVNIAESGKSVFFFILQKLSIIKSAHITYKLQQLLEHFQYNEVSF